MKFSLFRYKEHCVKYPDIFLDSEPAHVAIAKDFCARCVNQSECLDRGLEIYDGDVPDGTWGGKSREERRQIVGESIAVAISRYPQEAQIMLNEVSPEN